MKEVAYDATDVGGAHGKVWSDTRLNRRDVTTLMRVATFSGESRRALRTWEVSLAARPSSQMLGRTVMGRYEREDIRGRVKEGEILGYAIQ
jgi:hypothetical protein